jgi:hypothetical protein
MERDIEFRRAMIALKNDDLRSYEHLMKKWAVASRRFSDPKNFRKAVHGKRIRGAQ